MKKVLEELRDRKCKYFKEAYDLNLRGAGGNKSFPFASQIQYLDDFLRHRTIWEITEDERTIIDHFYDEKRESSFDLAFTEFMIKANKEAKEAPDQLDYFTEKLSRIANQLALDKLSIEETKAALSNFIAPAKEAQ